MTDDELHLREKARLLLQRERELFDLRQKHEQVGVWLNIGQALPDLFAGGARSLAQVWDGIRRLMVTRLRLQRLLLLEVKEDSLQPLAPTGNALPVSVRALLEAKPAGACNDPRAEADPVIVALAEALGLHRFVWSRIARAGSYPILLAAGFDRAKAAFQSPFESGDVAYFASTTRQMEALLGNAALIADLELEKDQLRRVNAELEQRDAALRMAAEQLRTANEGLEQRVQERTAELAGRNRAVRLVLDTVDQALLTVRLSGHLATERSSVTDSWFGSYTGNPSFADYVRADARFASLFELGLDALRENLLPRELCLGQLPTRLVQGARQFDCRYLPIDEDGSLSGLLIVIDDVTERLARAREEAERRELLAAFTGLMRDRNGFLTFFEETERLLELLARDGVRLEEQQRHLHTLKGNAATYGLELMAELCHATESDLAQDGTGTALLLQLRARWSAVCGNLRAAAADELGRNIEISPRDLDLLIERAQRGTPMDELIHELRQLTWESSKRPLERLAQHARALALRLGKAPLAIEIETDDTRLDPNRWTPLWFEVVHAVRNAVDHGIEHPAERTAAGKAHAGRLRLAARRVERCFQIDIEDDGTGIDWQAIRDRCKERGRPHATRAELVDAMLSQDFSTRAQVSDTSGRGVGLAALASAVSRLGGSVAVESEAGRGTCWTLSFPNIEARAPSQ
jgi:two-component system chemotaxis sensor kinase CheA